MPSEPVPLGQTPVTQVSRRAMATDFVVMLAGANPGLLETALTALEELDTIEGELTVYRDTSEISRLNRLGAESPVPIAASTYRLLQQAERWSRRTEGAFDVTAGPLVQAWGFMRRQGQKPTAADLEAALARVGYQHLVFDDTNLSVRFARPGMSINLGAIGKGHALDRLAERLQQAGATDFLIHGGNSSVIAQGDQQPGSGLGWAVGLAHPTKPKRRIAGVWLRNAALGTSGSGKQYFHHRGQRFGHVIDPRSGQPAGDLLSLTVIMPSATDADACATGLFVCGAEEAKRLAASSLADPSGESIPLILVHPGARQYQAELDASGEIPWVKDGE